MANFYLDSQFQLEIRMKERDVHQDTSIKNYKEINSDQILKLRGIFDYC